MNIKMGGLMRKKISCVCGIALLVSTFKVYGGTYVNSDRDREQIAQEVMDKIQQQRDMEESSARLRESLQRLKEKHEDQMNWAPDNDTTKEENKGRYWDSFDHEYKIKKRD